MSDPSTVTAFVGKKQAATGSLENVARIAFEIAGNAEAVLIFDDATGRVVDIDPRDFAAANGIFAQPPATLLRDADAPRKPGRPKLGVVAREVTLLPRHWDWLASQSGGASVALRKLVEEARRGRMGDDRRRLSQEAAFRFMSAMAGNEPGFEEANRALFAGSLERFRTSTARWPTDVAAHAHKLAAQAFDTESDHG